MPEARYTQTDSPHVVARIERDLALVVQTVRDEDPSLRSLVLTGGFARGEGTVIDGVPQNDYDFVAIRGLLPPRTPYARVRARLEAQLGLHVDLAPVVAWRLPWVARSIFWYETALRGRVLWGQELLHRIPVRTPRDIDPEEGLRLLVNRAAGLLLVTGNQKPAAVRLQASKAFLAAADAHLFARGEFLPSQTERWRRLEELRDAGQAPEGIEPFARWLRWAYEAKVNLGHAAPPDASQAWQAAAKAIVDSVPMALRHANLPSLEAFGRRDGLVDHLIYYRRAANIPGARPLLLHPTGRVRVATLRLLEASLDGHVRPEAARRCFADIAPVPERPLRLLAALRTATLQ